MTMESVEPASANKRNFLNSQNPNYFDQKNSDPFVECEDLQEEISYPVENDLRHRSKGAKVKRANSYSSSVYDEENRKKSFNEEDRPDIPCHFACDSLFSTSSGFQNFRGLLNWCILMLAFTTGRAALENLMKYGILIDPINWYKIFVHSPTSFPIMWIISVLGIIISISFLIEKMAAASLCSESVITVLHSLNLFVEITLPAVLVYHFHPHPFLSAPLLGFCVIIFLKLISYAQVNKWCRLHLRKKQTTSKFRGVPCRIADCLSRFSANKDTNSRMSGASAPNKFDECNRQIKKALDCLSLNHRSMSFQTKESITREFQDDNGLITKKVNDTIDPKKYMIITEYQEYPDNININDFCYFLFAPTVCYELNFPRTTRIRKRFLINRGIESLFLWGLMLSLIQQWIYPTVENSVEMFQQMNYPMMVDRILKLAIPNHLIWLMAFYWYFHSCCNLVAELMRFGDRMFYKDWWNAEDLQQFWSTWNIPVHRFSLRHVYKPLVSRGISRTSAVTVVFLISAFFHEYLCSIPLKMFRPWFFVSFALQIPLFVMSPRLKGKLGNIIMWMMVMLGQPVAMLMYFHDYYIAHRV